MKNINTKIKFLLLALLCVSSMFLFSCDQKSDFNSDIKSSVAKDESVLRIATTAGNEPFEYMDDDGTLLGIDIAVGMLIAEEMDKKPIFENVNYENLMDGLNTGIYDIVISSLTVSDNLKQQVDLTDEYLTLSSSIVASNINTNITDLKSLKKATSVAVVAGTTESRYLNNSYGLNNVIEYRNSNDAMNAMLDNSSDALFIDDNIAKTLVNTYPIYKITTSGIDYRKYSVATAKGDYEMVLKINKILHKLEGNGALVNIRKAYIEKDANLKIFFNNRLKELQ